jgi:hypothetical protein
METARACVFVLLLCLFLRGDCDSIVVEWCDYDKWGQSSCNAELKQLSLVVGCRGESRDIHVREPVHGGGVAGHPVECREREAGPDGFRAAARHVARRARAVGLVRPAVGAHRLRAGRVREVRVRHGRLRLGLPRVQRPKRRDAGHAGRVHARRQRRQRLLRRQPGGRLQPADADRALRRGRRDNVRRGRMRGGPEHAVPRGAPGARRRGVPERVRRVRQARVLLQRRVRQPQHLPPHPLLSVVQVGVPQVVQLRLRRPHQHLHLLRRPRLHHHLLPRRHPKVSSDSFDQPFTRLHSSLPTLLR